MANSLRVNLEGESKIEPIEEKVQRDFLGARGFAAKYLYEELLLGSTPYPPRRNSSSGPLFLEG